MLLLAQHNFTEKGGMPATGFTVHPVGSSNDSDKCDSIKRFWRLFKRYYNGCPWDNFFYIFQVILKNQEIVYQHNIAEKYYKIGRSKLRRYI